MKNDFPKLACNDIVSKEARNSTLEAFEAVQASGGLRDDVLSPPYL